jgi:hypothetical protein
LKNYFFNNIALGNPDIRRDNYRFATRPKGREKKIGYSAVGGILLLRNSEPNFAGTGIGF